MLNSSVINLYKSWEDRGKPLQSEMSWEKSRMAWMNALPTYSNFLRNLPSQIGREFLRRESELRECTADEFFILVMIWGYGDIGYGPFRVSKMVESENFEFSVKQIHSKCLNGEIVDAYRLAFQSKIKQLGPAFATKYICFASPKKYNAPIYDSFIWKWIKKFAPEVFGEKSGTPETWSISTYRAYSDWIGKHCLAVGCTSDELELVIFEDALITFAEKSAW